MKKYAPSVDELLNHEDYEVQLARETVLVRRGVFTPDPRITNSPTIMLERLPDLEGKDVLDMGTGCGIIAIVCAKKGARRVVGADISKIALDNARQNAETQPFTNIEFVESDLFQNVQGRFDYIFANLPIEDEIWKVEGGTVATIEKFLKEAKSHLKEGGTFYLIWFADSEPKHLSDLLAQYGYTYELVVEEKLGTTWYLFIARPRDKKFFYEQYNEIDWSKQEETEVNFPVNEFIIDYILSKHNAKNISLFDIGFGIGFFLKMFAERAKAKYNSIHIEGCEPSSNSYKHLGDKMIEGVKLVTHPSTFLEVETPATFDFMTAVYVLPHILFEDLEATIQKIHSMLKSQGGFICVITNEKSFKTREKNDKDLFNVVEEKMIVYDDKEYTEILHKSLIPDIGYVYDYNRDESLYMDMFSKNGFTLEKQQELNDGYFLHSILVFQKQEA